MTSQESVYKINKVIWMTKSRINHARISVAKQYQKMSSVARVKFIKAKFIFRYHTKNISGQVSSNLDYWCSNFSTKMGKNEKLEKKFLCYKTAITGLRVRF